MNSPNIKRNYIHLHLFFLAEILTVADELRNDSVHELDRVSRVWLTSLISIWMELHGDTWCHFGCFVYVFYVIMSREVLMMVLCLSADILKMHLFASLLFNEHG